AVILWAAYVFTGIWLRMRCARELAAAAQPLHEIVPLAKPDLPLEHDGAIETADDPGTASLHYGYYDSGDVLLFLGERASVSIDRLLDRLESLQHPTLRTLWQSLLRKDEPRHKNELVTT